MSSRVAIVFDGQQWYVRSIRVIEHDVTRDEKVYRCDQPLGVAHDTMEAATETASKWPASRAAVERERAKLRKRF